MMFLMGASSTSSAQSDQPVPLPPPPKPKPLGQMTFGALTMTPSIALLNVGIDNNVLNTNGSTQSDLTATVSPQLKLQYKAGRLMVDSTTTGDYVREVAMSDSYWSAHFAGAGRPLYGVVAA